MLHHVSSQRGNSCKIGGHAPALISIPLACPHFALQLRASPEQHAVISSQCRAHPLGAPAARAVAYSSNAASAGSMGSNGALKRHPSRVRPTGSCGLARASGVTDDLWGPNRSLTICVDSRQIFALVSHGERSGDGDQPACYRARFFALTGRHGTATRRSGCFSSCSAAVCTFR